ncbi:MAG: class I SAM-dependent methyltransferase [Candidatus Brockarchaeota archaeon]|nr:class I SAM-dependent methyltransferase [Candidatus Brockarchaeota archaeon]
MIDHDGNVIDLGCGNGLMLRRLVTRSSYKLIPYGVDFIEESIKQAIEVILPMYAGNFAVTNIVVVDLGINFFDFIFFDPSTSFAKVLPKR